MSCTHSHVLTMADRTGTAQYGMLYAYYPSGSSGACVTDIASAVGSVPGGWALATLNSAGDPSPGDAQVTANLEHVPHGGVNYVTVQKVVDPPPGTPQGPKCLAYYATTDADAVSAYNEISEYWPAFLPDGTRESAVNCVAQAPSTPPPPAVPSPPFSPPLRCGPMGSRYAGWRPTDNGGAEYMRTGHRQPHIHEFSGMPLKVLPNGLEMFDNLPQYPKQHTPKHIVGCNGAQGCNNAQPRADLNEASRKEFESIAGNAWMQNEFPGGMAPSGNNADGVPYDFDCAKECTMHYEAFGAMDDPNLGYYESRLQSYKNKPNPRFNDHIPFFTVRSPGSGLIEQKRLKYDNIDMCRACRQKCCQRACCDGDDDQSWTWGCDVFRQKRNPNAPTPMPDANNDGYPDALFSSAGVHNGAKAPLSDFPFDWSGQQRDAADPYWYGLETGGIEESYGGEDPASYGSDLGAVRGYLWQANLNYANTKWRNDALYNPVYMGWQGNDQPWDNECEVADELQCDYVPPATSRMIQTRILFSGTVETFPVGRLHTNFAYAVDVPVQDVEVHVQPGSVSANIRVAAAENNLVYVQNRMLAVTANVSHASAKIGFPVEKILEAPNVQAQSPNAPPPPPGAPPPPPRNPYPPAPPPPPPANTVHYWTVYVRGNPAQIDKDAFIAAASLALRISALSINATVSAYRPGISRIDGSVRSVRPTMPRLIESRYGSLLMANTTLQNGRSLRRERGRAVRGRRQRRHVLALPDGLVELGGVLVLHVPLRRDGRRHGPQGVGVAARHALGPLLPRQRLLRGRPAVGQARHHAGRVLRRLWRRRLRQPLRQLHDGPRDGLRQDGARAVHGGHRLRRLRAQHPRQREPVGHRAPRVAGGEPARDGAARARRRGGAAPLCARHDTRQLARAAEAVPRAVGA